MKLVAERLEAWRAAERRWELGGSEAEVRAAAGEVVASWLDYQNGAMRPSAREFVLVAGDEQRLVGATSGISAVLGYAPAEIVGLTIQSLAAPDFIEATPSQWAAFVAAGRQDGRYALLSKDGRRVPLRYQARAHHPVPGFHVSRLWPDDAA